MSRFLHRPWGLLLLVGLTSGCALLGQPKDRLTKAPVVAQFYGDAGCHKDPTQGLAIAKSLLAEDPDNPATQLLHAYLIERTGRPVHAWELYGSLTKGDYSQSTSLTCNGTLVYNGAVSDVARFRAKWLVETLKSQGIDLLPSMAKPPSKEPIFTKTSKVAVVLPPPFTEPKPAALTPPSTTVMAQMPAITAMRKEQPAAPGPFLHLASYKGQKALDRGWVEISTRYKKLLQSRSKAVQTVTLKAQDKPILRLGVYAKDKTDAQGLCKSLKANRQYCAILK